MHPFREPVPIEADTARTLADPPIGSRRSVHAPPALLKALVGPLLIAVVFFAVLTLLVRAPALVSLTISGGTLALLAWPPIRTRRQEVDLHDKGVVLSRGGSRTVVAFEDVDEVWFEIPPLHSTQGAYLRALRLVDFDGKTHRVPLTLDGGATLARAILRGCSTPLWIEARNALAEGEVLTFGRNRLDRSGITVNEAYAAWRDIRRARLQPARVTFFRRLPLFPWRTVRLDRIPNPSVFCALVAQNVRDVRCDDRLMVELDSAGDVAIGRLSRAQAKTLALRNMLVGGVFFLIGTGITWATSSHHGYQVIAFGPILFGAVRFIQGVIAFGSKGSR
jgi:Family of unknown function (DUF6585)